MSFSKAKLVSPKKAVESIKSNDRLIIPICCGLPQALMEALIEEKDRLKDVEIVGGLQIEYKFLEEGLEDSFFYRTWQCTPAIRRLLKKGIVKYIPMRQGDVPAVFSKNGIWPIDVALIQVSPPDKHGYCSLGVSISHSLPTALDAKLVIAEVNDQMPRVLGNSFIHLSQIDYMVESSRSLLEYPSSKILGEKEKVIGKLVSNLIPDGATLQIGIGMIPEAIIQSLEDGKNLKFFAMGIDGIVDLVEKGVVAQRNSLSNQTSVIVCEVLGTKKIFDFVHSNPLVEGRPTSGTINPQAIAKIDKFVSIISAIEVDLTGQVNSETIMGEQFSAIGGSFDFVQGALFSRGGNSIIALTSTAGDGKSSRIVSKLPIGSVVTIPRHCVQYIVTEYGIADLRGKSLRERAEALINIAHPSFQEDLRKSLTG